MSLTIEQYNQQLTEAVGLISGSLAQDAILPAGREMLAAIKTRIYSEGKNSAGGNIGDYSTKPMYAEKSKFVRPGFVAQGKNNFDGNTIGDVLIPTIRLKKNSRKKSQVKYSAYTLVKPNYQERKTMYLREGYKELRDVQSLRTDIMNFSYSGKLLETFIAEKDGEIVLLGLTSDESADKRAGLESKKGRVFPPTSQEIEAYKSYSNFLIRRLVRNAIKGYDVTATVE